jgi:hypothetical protein
MESCVLGGGKTCVVTVYTRWIWIEQPVAVGLWGVLYECFAGAGAAVY